MALTGPASEPTDKKCSYSTCEVMSAREWKFKIQGQKFVVQNEDGPYFILCPEHSNRLFSDDVLKTLKTRDGTTFIPLDNGAYIRAYTE